MKQSLLSANTRCFSQRPNSSPDCLKTTGAGFQPAGTERLLEPLHDIRSRPLRGFVNNNSSRKLITRFEPMPHRMLNEADDIGVRSAQPHPDGDHDPAPLHGLV